MGIETGPKDIVTSVGGLGIQRRSDQRIYFNRRSPVSKPDHLSRDFDRLARIIGIVPESPNADAPDQAGRAVMRFVATEDALRELLEPSHLLSTHVEMAFPLRDGGYFVGLARNGENRRSRRSITEMMDETSNFDHPRKDKNPFDSVRHVANEGYSFRTLMPDSASQERVFSLWEKTFGWERDQVRNLADRLHRQSITGEDPSVWFCALEKTDGGKPQKKEIVAVAMGEKITFKGVSGKDVEIVELTEWSVGEANRGNGYMPATITRLICQILNDYRAGGKEDPQLFAECNITAKAHRSGHSSGLTVPERTIFESKTKVPQVLQQSVAVGDGGDPGLRDFVIMRLSHRDIEKYYTEDTVKKVLEMTI